MKYIELFTLFAVVIGVILCIYVTIYIFAPLPQESRIISISDGPEMQKATRMALEK